MIRLSAAVLMLTDAMNNATDARTIGCAVVLKTSDGYLHSEPKTDAPIATRFSPGNVVIVSSDDDESGTWRRVSTCKGDIDGWIKWRGLKWVECPEYPKKNF